MSGAAAPIMERGAEPLRFKTISRSPAGRFGGWEAALFDLAATSSPVGLTGDLEIAAP